LRSAFRHQSRKEQLIKNGWKPGEEPKIGRGANGSSISTIPTTPASNLWNSHPCKNPAVRTTPGPIRIQTMICPCSRSRFHWVRQLCSLIALLRGVVPCPQLAPKVSTNPSKPSTKTSPPSPYTPDGRIVYSVHRSFKTKLYDLEHDDIWLQDASASTADSSKVRNSVAATNPSATSEILSASPPTAASSFAELLTTTVVDDSGKAEDSFQTLLLDDSGKEIHIAKGEASSQTPPTRSSSPTNVTINYLSEAVKTAHALLPESHSPQHRRFQVASAGSQFRDVVPLPGVYSAIAVEQDHAMTGPSRLQRIELFTEDDKELARSTATKAVSVSPPAAKKWPILLTRKFWKFATSLRPIFSHAFESVSASSAGHPSKRASS